MYKCINVNVGVGALLPFVPGCIDCGQSDNGSLISRHRPAQPCPARTLPQHLAPQISISFVVMLWYIGIQRDTHRDTCALVWPIYLHRDPPQHGTSHVKGGREGIVILMLICSCFEKFSYVSNDVFQYFSSTKFVSSLGIKILSWKFSVF